LNRTTGKLIANTPSFTAVPPGDGPRHFAFYPNGRLVYSLQEEASTIMVWAYSATTGALAEEQLLSSLPSGFVGTNFTSKSGSQRTEKPTRPTGCTTASGFSTLTGTGWNTSEKPEPAVIIRASFTVDPTASFLISWSQRSDSLSTYRIQEDGGKLTFTVQYTPIGSPAIIVFLT
jgi:6-phosphogluconolactonase